MRFNHQRSLILFLVILLVFPSPAIFAQIFPESIVLPTPGKIVAPSPQYDPVVLKGIRVDLKDPFRFEFYIDAGQSKADKDDLKLEAEVYERQDRAFVLKSRLKVLLEEDYVALNKNDKSATLPITSINSQQNQHSEKLQGVSLQKDTHAATSQIIREIILPEIEKEINEGKNFVQLRQIYQALILASWFKKRFGESFLGLNYVGQNKVKGVDVRDKQIAGKIYEQYLKAYKKGVYNYVREEYDISVHSMVPRKYFSGGVVVGHEIDRAMSIVPLTTGRQFQESLKGPLLAVSAGNKIEEQGGTKDRALLATITPVDKILSMDRLRFTDPRTGAVNQDFTARMRESDKEFRDFMVSLAKAGVDEKTGKLLNDERTIARKQIELGLKQAEIVREWYNIGRVALDKDGNEQTVKNRNYLAALIAFKKVAETQPLLRAVYGNIVIASEYKP
ncbi:MAG: hypothetical protein HY591_05295, partial [Candidatus Omnitrophica bacterium]|nr:hypothetical protein [Candidatus Omnitrophota bacterium]